MREGEGKALRALCYRKGRREVTNIFHSHEEFGCRMQFKMRAAILPDLFPAIVAALSTLFSIAPCVGGFQARLLLPLCPKQEVQLIVLSWPPCCFRFLFVPLVFSLVQAG